jgi:hypothetical protein
MNVKGALEALAAALVAALPAAAGETVRRRALPL